MVLAIEHQHRCPEPAHLKCIVSSAGNDKWLPVKQEKATPRKRRGRKAKVAKIEHATADTQLPLQGPEPVLEGVPGFDEDTCMSQEQSPRTPASSACAEPMDMDPEDCAGIQGTLPSIARSPPLPAVLHSLNSTCCKRVQATIVPGPQGLVLGPAAVVEEVQMPTEAATSEPATGQNQNQFINVAQLLEPGRDWSHLNDRTARVRQEVDACDGQLVIEEHPLVGPLEHVIDKCSDQGDEALDSCSIDSDSSAEEGTALAHRQPLPAPGEYFADALLEAEEEEVAGAQALQHHYGIKQEPEDGALFVPFPGPEDEGHTSTGLASALDALSRLRGGDACNWMDGTSTYNCKNLVDKCAEDKAEARVHTWGNIPASHASSELQISRRRKGGSQRTKVTLGSRSPDSATSGRRCLVRYGKSEIPSVP